jgi:hypothetical protein
MMHAMSPDDLPRIKIVRHDHSQIANFYRYGWQVFLGQAIPPSKESDWPPVEDYVLEGWKLGFTADELGPLA